MYVNYYGNVIADCVIVTSPKYKEEVGEHRRELTTVFAKSKEATPEGLQTVNLNLLFFSAFAIPAMKLSPTMCIVIGGREAVQEAYQKGKTVLERTLYIDWWMPRDIDPVGHLEELKVRREIQTRETEFKNIFWDWLQQCKALILKWFNEWKEAPDEGGENEKRNSDN